MHARLWITGCCIALGACQPLSIHPYYQASQLTFDSTLVGSWADSGGKSNAIVSRERDHYSISYRDEGRNAIFEARLFRLGSQLALDITPASLPDSLTHPVADEYWSLLVPGHALFWLTLGTNRLMIRGLDPDTLRAFVLANPQSVEHHVEPGDTSSTVVLTAPTPSLQAFVQDYRRRPHAMGDSTIWIRKRV